MNPGIKLRTLTPGDWQAYRDLRRRALEDSPEAFSSTLAQSLAIPDEEWRARLVRVMPTTDYPLAADSAAGLCGLVWSRVEADDSSVAQLYQMWVAPEVRGQGVGREMVNAALAWMRSIGIKRAILGVTSGDRPARRLYESIGFTPYGEPEPLREGSTMTIDNMELLL